MNPNYMTRVPNILRGLEISFSFEPLAHPVRIGARVQEFDAKVSSRVWCTDGTILPRFHQRTVARMRALAGGPIFYWDREHCIDSQMDLKTPVRVYKNFSSRDAKKACKIINDRIAALIAPSQRVWIQHSNLARDLMVSASEFLVAFYVMST
jgi:hypothetical protein